ncbi:MAG: hypothetical protein ABJF11_11320 [Reichenbachiella sp.]|uniref:Kelch repeat-containing protein n=1 Tax=Reichenbachiella sp. TaxID=2184521 RepID=UPI003262ED30
MTSRPNQLFSCSNLICLLLLSTLISSSCSEEDQPLKDVLDVSLTAPEISQLGLYQAHIEGTVVFEGEELKNKGFGVVWSTFPNPEPHDSISEAWPSNPVSGIGRSPFPIFDIATQLELNTQYYARTYFVFEDLSMIYSEQVSFTTLESDAWHVYAESQYPGELRQFPSGFLIENSFHVGMGFKDGSPTSITEWWAYDIDANTWEQKESIPDGVGFESRGFSIGSKGYMLSSSDNENPATFWEYDAINDRWSKKSSFPGQSRNHPLSIAVNGKGYIGGGSFQFSNDLWEFDPTDESNGMDANGNLMGSWTEKTAATGGVIGQPAVFAIDDVIYVYNVYSAVNSNNQQEDQAQFWAYTPSTDEWTIKAAYPGELDQRNELTMAVFSIGNLGYLGGGKYDSFWIYNPSTDSWTQANDAPIVDAEISFSTSDRGYFFSSGNSIFEYVP